jgi:cellulose synthase/poly-beta-1,6-N-acetylglucosamine synthase-like glycosyltransferase
MKKQLNFDGYRFESSFNFRNKKAKINYFTDLLINQPNKFKEEQSKYFEEKLHILFSFHDVFKYLFYAFIGITLTSILIATGAGLIVNPVLIIIYAAISILLKILQIIFKYKFNIDASSYMFTTALNEDSFFFEEYRKEVMKDSSIN